jgi:lipopolysaccharide export system ATP-binding protein
MGGCLRAIQLTKHFGRRQVVKGVDILIQPGEIVALLGRNGAGKSTTFQMIAGQTSPDSGDIQLDDRSILRLPAYARSRLGLTYLPQERSVFLKLSVSENIGVPLEQRGFSKRDKLRRTEELLAEFGLTYAARMAPMHCQAEKPESSKWRGHSPLTRISYSSTNRSPAWIRFMCERSRT